MQFIKLPHQIFKYRLPANALVAYLALARYSHRYHSGCFCCTVSLGRLSSLMGCSKDTVRRAVACLQEHGLVKLVPRRDPDGLRITNTYMLACLPGRFTMVPMGIFSCHLSKQQMAVYLYLISKQSGTRQEVFPSLSEMTTNLRLSKRSVIDAVRFLESEGLVVKKSYRRLDGSLGRNRHRVYPPDRRAVLCVLPDCSAFTKRKWAVPTHRIAHTASCRTTHCSIIVPHSVLCVNRQAQNLFLPGGGTSLQHRSKPTVITAEKERMILTKSSRYHRKQDIFAGILSFWNSRRAGPLKSFGFFLRFAGRFPRTL